MNTKTTIQYPICWFDDNDVMWVDFGTLQNITATHMVCIHRWHVEHDYRPKAVVNIITSGRTITLEALKMVEKPPFSEVITCSAVVVESSLIRLFSRIYLPLFQSVYPVKLFATQEEAVAWCLKTRTVC